MLERAYTDESQGYMALLGVLVARLTEVEQHRSPLGLEVDGQAQVSMNLVDTSGTPVHRVVEMIRSEAGRYGVPIVESEVVGLVSSGALLDAGMSQGAVMAFLIAGSGTSIGAIVGALTIARWRVVALVVGILWVGAILSGLAFNWVLTWGMF